MQSTKETWFLLLSIPLYLILIVGEVLMSNWKGHRFYSVKDTVQNIYLTLSNGLLDLLLRSLFYVSVLVYYHEHRLFSIENVYLYWLLLFLLEDLAFYFEHRIDHFCRLFWAVHVTHHSSSSFNLTTGFRSSVFQPVYRFVYFIPIALMGFHPLDIVFMYSITQTYGILVHTQYVKKMPGWFEAIFVSPSHHRVHHASNLIYLDKNMGMCLIIWDRLFGTFQKELIEEPVVYGLTKPMKTDGNPVNVVLHEWQDIVKDLRKTDNSFHRIKYLLMPPGWSHDGSSKTAKELRKEPNIQDVSAG